MVSRESKIKMASGYGVTEGRAAAPLKEIGMLGRGQEVVQGFFDTVGLCISPESHY